MDHHSVCWGQQTTTMPYEVTLRLCRIHNFNIHAGLRQKMTWTSQEANNVAVWPSSGVSSSSSSSVGEIFCKRGILVEDQKWSCNALEITQNGMGEDEQLLIWNTGAWCRRLPLTTRKMKCRCHCDCNACSSSERKDGEASVSCIAAISDLTVDPSKKIEGRKKSQS
jgi:hypothetical protein